MYFPNAQVHREIWFGEGNNYDKLVGTFAAGYAVTLIVAFQFD